jgi:hypothetical protein
MLLDLGHTRLYSEWVGNVEALRARYVARSIKRSPRRVKAIQVAAVQDDFRTSGSQSPCDSKAYAFAGPRDQGSSSSKIEQFHRSASNPSGQGASVRKVISGQIAEKLGAARPQSIVRMGSALCDKLW